MIVLRIEAEKVLDSAVLVESNVCPVGIVLDGHAVISAVGHPEFLIVRACDGQTHRHDQLGIDHIRAVCRKKAEEGSAKAWAIVEPIQLEQEGTNQQPLLHISFAHRGGYSQRGAYGCRIATDGKLELGEWHLLGRQEISRESRKEGEPDGAVNRSQPVQTDTHPPPLPAGSGH